MKDDLILIQAHFETINIIVIWKCNTAVVFIQTFIQHIICLVLSLKAPPRTEKITDYEISFVLNNTLSVEYF